jgi:HlyD family secretion protein
MSKICGKTWMLLIGALLLVSLALGAASMLLPGMRRGTSADPPPAEAVRPVEVEAVKVERTTLHPSLDLVGQIVAMPERTAVVSSQSGGWVSSVDVVEGQKVHAGDILVMLDSRRAESDLLRAKAVLSQMQATLAKLKQGPLPEEIDAARHAREVAQANVDSLRTEVSALEKLLQRNEISRVQYETKQKALEAAQASLASADANLKLLENGTRPEMIAEAQAQVDVAAADVHAAQLAVDWCTIRSPINGVVVQLSARQGQFFDQAAPLATINDLSEVFAQVRIPSDAVASLRVGSPVEVRVAAFPGEVFPGKVSRRSGEADSLSGDLSMYVTVKNPDDRLTPGFSCHARVWLPPVADALAVPVSAIADHDGRTVVTAIRDGKAEETAVTVGTQADGLVQVLSGLAPGDLVATKGGYGLPNGYPVETVTSPRRD